MSTTAKTTAYGITASLIRKHVGEYGVTLGLETVAELERMASQMEAAAAIKPAGVS